MAHAGPSKMDGPYEVSRDHCCSCGVIPHGEAICSARICHGSASVRGSGSLRPLAAVASYIKLLEGVGIWGKEIIGCVMVILFVELCVEEG